MNCGRKISSAFNRPSVAVALSIAVWSFHTQQVWATVSVKVPVVSQASPSAVAHVYVGAYLIRIPSLSFRDNQWTIDAYIWFRWKGDLNPSPSDAFELCNGSIEKREVTDAKKVKVKNRGTEEEYNYACVRIQATLSSIWDVSRFPFDHHALKLLIEDEKRESSLIRYLVDERTSGIDGSCQVPGWVLGPPQVSSIVHKYPTNYGDPEQSIDVQPSYSRLVFEVPMTRFSPGWYAFKVLNGLYVAVLISILALLVKPSRPDVRFGMGVGAVFAAIASQYVTAASLPETGQLTLVDTLFVIGTAVIFLSLVESTMALHFMETGRPHAAKRLDRISVVVLAGGYLALNGWLIWPS
jgi:hypothetical protein